MLVLVAAAAATCGWPSNMAEFPDSSAYRPMNAPGVYDPRIVAGGAIRCRGAGVVVVGASSVGGVRVARRHNVRTQVVETLPFEHESTAYVMCANYGRAWRWAKVLPGGAAADPEETAGVGKRSAASVLVVGGGVGGWAVAAAAGVPVTVVDPGGSTTARSSGVAWFPRAHTGSMLLEATGAQNGGNASRLSTYAAGGKASFAFWERRLALEPWPSAEAPVPDYTAYTTGAQRGHSFHSPTHYSDPELTGGAQLLRRLRSLSNASVVTDVVVALRERADGRFVAALGSGGEVVADAVVLATGGLAHAEGVYEADRVLAGGENDGLAARAAASLGLAPAARPLRHWHLEFADAGEGWAERWFAIACGASEPQYELCRDYSTRSQALYASKRTLPVDANAKTTAACPNESGQFWDGFFTAFFEQGVDAHAAAALACATTQLAAGVIDTKGSFALTETFASVSNPRVFASGTAAAAFTGDAYFAPGATIGLALHVGRVVAEELAKLPLVERAEPTVEYRDNPAPALFLAGAWALGVGVVAHAFSGGGARVVLAYAHYLLMTAGTALVFVGVYYARKEAAGAATGSHANTGRATAVLLAVNVILGTTLRAMDVLDGGTLRERDAVRRAAGFVHRLTGLAIVGAVGFLVYSATHDGPMDVYGRDWRGQFHAYTAVCAVAAGSFALYASHGLASHEQTYEQVGS